MLRWLALRLARRAGLPLHGASKLLRGRGHATRADVCVGNGDGIAEEEWAIKLSSFPVCVSAADLDDFQPSVAQASSEGWFGRVWDRGVCFYFWPRNPYTSQWIATAR